MKSLFTLALVLTASAAFGQQQYFVDPGANYAYNDCVSRVGQLANDRAVIAQRATEGLTGWRGAVAAATVSVASGIGSGRLNQACYQLAVGSLSMQSRGMELTHHERMAGILSQDKAEMNRLLNERYRDQTGRMEMLAGARNNAMSNCRNCTVAEAGQMANNAAPAIQGGNTFAEVPFSTGSGYDGPVDVNGNPLAGAKPVKKAQQQLSPEAQALPRADPNATVVR